MDAAYSPLFEPVFWEGNGFRILDELLLPEQIHYIGIRDPSQAVDAVRTMRTRAFGQVLTFFYTGALLSQSYRGNQAEPLRYAVKRMIQQFCEARPTFDFRGLGECFERWFENLPADVDAGEWITDQACEFAAQIIRARVERAKRAAEILPDPARLLTHCNISGELVAVARHCKELGKELAVIATETRPYMQGTRLTAWELAEAGVPVSLIPDCAIAQVMAKGDVNAVIVGSDRAAQNGEIINKVGTYPIALMARQYGIPFYVLVQDPRSLARGSDVPIEERPASELLDFQGQRLIADDRIAVRYPAFDVTPSGLITHMIGLDDLYTPASFRRKYQQRAAAEVGRSTAKTKYLLIYGIPPQDQLDYLLSALKAEQAGGLLIAEMRPQLWGVHAVAPALLKRNAPTTLISDNMMGTIFARDEIRKLYLYYSALEERGPQGICGSLLAVCLARAHGVPIELLASEESQDATLDADASTFMGMSLCPTGVSIYPLTTEVVPWALFKDPSENADEKV